MPLEKKKVKSHLLKVLQKKLMIIDQYKCGSVDFYVILPSSIFDLSGGNSFVLTTDSFATYIPISQQTKINH